MNSSFDSKELKKNKKNQDSTRMQRTFPVVIWWFAVPNVTIWRNVGSEQQHSFSPQNKERKTYYKTINT